MKTLKTDVTSSRKKGGGNFTNDKGEVIRQIVSSATYSEYDSLPEAVNAIGTETCLAHINAQIATNAKNKARAEAVGAPSETALREEATMRLMQDPGGLMQIGQAAKDAAGDPVRYKALMDSVLSAVITQIKTERGISTDEA